MWKLILDGLCQFITLQNQLVLLNSILDYLIMKWNMYIACMYWEKETRNYRKKLNKILQLSPIPQDSRVIRDFGRLLKNESIY